MDSPVPRYAPDSVIGFVRGFARGHYLSVFTKRNHRDCYNIIVHDGRPVDGTYHFSIRVYDGGLSLTPAACTQETMFCQFNDWQNIMSNEQVIRFIALRIICWIINKWKSECITIHSVFTLTQSSPSELLDELTENVAYREVRTLVATAVNQWIINVVHAA